MRHVDESKWVSTKGRFAIAGLLSGAISIFLTTTTTIIMFFNGSPDVMGNALKTFALMELLVVILLAVTASASSAMQSFGTKRITFCRAFREIFGSIEQVWFYIPLTLALVVYLMFGGI